MWSYITSISFFLLSPSVCSRSEVSSRRLMHVSTSARLSCIAVTVAFISVDVSLIVVTSVATLCSVLLILAISVNRESKLGGGSMLGLLLHVKGFVE